tara:strand:- start:16041 stop:16217 length:177 start_codon:yes stop_codon:yes gene_type:complete
MEQLTPFIRYALQIGAGSLVTSGHIDENAAQQIVGIGMSVAGLVWYQFSRSRAALKEK